ncbi:MAG: hormogonium polysaccharide biosynthesis glycosyltransferase HpsO [Prochlorotrichaceae cyanobacterium]|jgi:glycosyltransferase involved in cell wall biosynthesis
MKIVVVSHSYIVELNRERLKILSQLEPGIEVTIGVPKRWREGGVMGNLVEPTPYQSGSFQVVPLPNFHEENQGMLCFGWAYVQLLRSFRPDVILVEQGAKSLALAQSILINQVFRLKAKICFFTWWNLPYDLRFPVSALEAYNLRYTQGLIAGNQDGLDLLRQHGYRNQAIVMPQLGVDEHLFRPQPQPELMAQLGIQSQDFVVGFVGRFVVEKGILTLIKALSSLQERSWKLLLLGRGELETTIQDCARESGVFDRLLIINSVPHDQVYRYINLMDTLVLPSETLYAQTTLTAKGWKEQFGHVLIEAMACQVPVLGSDSGEIPRVIGEAGLIFPEGNVTALQECLVQLMDSPDLCRTLGQKGYDRVLEQYTNHALAQKLLSFFRAI